MNGEVLHLWVNMPLKNKGLLVEDINHIAHFPIDASFLHGNSKIIAPVSNKNTAWHMLAIPNAQAIPLSLRYSKSNQSTRNLVIRVRFKILALTVCFLEFILQFLSMQINTVKAVANENRSGCLFYYLRQ